MFVARVSFAHAQFSVAMHSCPGSSERRRGEAPFTGVSLRSRHWVVSEQFPISVGHERGLFVASDLKINRIIIEIGPRATAARDAGLAGSCTRRQNTSSRALSAVKVPRAPSAQTGSPAQPNVPHHSIGSLLAQAPTHALRGELVELRKGWSWPAHTHAGSNHLYAVCTWHAQTRTLTQCLFMPHLRTHMPMSRGMHHTVSRTCRICWVRRCWDATACSISLLTD